AVNGKYDASVTIARKWDLQLPFLKTLQNVFTSRIFIAASTSWPSDNHSVPEGPLLTTNQRDTRQRRYRCPVGQMHFPLLQAGSRHSSRWLTWPKCLQSPGRRSHQ